MRAIGAALALVAALALTGCSASPGSDAPGTGDTTLRVLAAASLTEAFSEIEQDFEAEHPGVDVALSFDSSATLAQQVTEGAPADVLATADTATMQRVVDAGDTESDPVTFATNALALVVPADNPAGITSFADLGRADVDYVACVESAPCGAVAQRLLAVDGVSHRPKSLEVDVKAVLTKVTLDEADAGLVYVTDAKAAGNAVKTFPVPGADTARNTYPMTVVAGTEHADLAAEWLDLVLSPTGQKALTGAGFGSAR